MNLVISFDAAASLTTFPRTYSFHAFLQDTLSNVDSHGSGEDLFDHRQRARTFKGLSKASNRSCSTDA